MSAAENLLDVLQVEHKVFSLYPHVHWNRPCSLEFLENLRFQCFQEPILLEPVALLLVYHTRTSYLACRGII